MNFKSINLTTMMLFLLVISVCSLSSLAMLNALALESQPAQDELIGPNLEPFAGAYKEVSQIHTAYKERIIQSDDPTQADTLQQEANQKMNQAVTKYGLTIEDYNTIFKAILNDPTLKEEFMMVLNRKP